MVKILLYLAAFLLLVFFHNNVLLFGLKIRLPYTFSMILPYVLQFLFVCLIVYQVFMTFLKEKAHWIRRIVSLVIFAGLCGFAFALHPIYEGDFTNEYNVVTINGESENIFQDGLNMVAIPGCPYCHERLEQFKFMQAIYPNLTLHILVVNKDSLAVNDYLDSGGENITVELFPINLAQSRAINPGVYPTLFYKPKTSPNELIRWDNNSFGSAAWDYIFKSEKN